MTTALQFSVYDMCHCYNNLNSTHTLNMIVYFCPFGLQFELLQQTQMRWPSWFQDLESYQPMGGGLSLVQLTAVIWCSFARTKLTKPLHQTTCSTMRGAFVTLMAMAASCSRKIPAPLGQAYSTGGGFTASATTPCSSGSIIRSSNQSSIISPAMITVLCNFHSRGGGCVYTSYHGFHESPYPEIRRHSLLPDNLQCVKGIKLPCDGWLLQTRHAAMWFMPTANMHNLIRTDI